MDRIFNYQKWHFGMEELAFRDIIKFDYEVAMMSHKDGNHVVGRFYLETKEKRIRILSVSKAVVHSKAFFQFRMEQDMERLKRILEAEAQVG